MNKDLQATGDAVGTPQGGDPGDALLLSVVICTFNRSDILVCCLESLVKQSAGKETFEVLVVDNNSTDATFAVATSFAPHFTHFRVITEQKQGLSNARNRGWHEARGAYVAYIDDDAVARSEWVSAICDFIARRPDAGVFGGPYDAFFLAPPPAWFPPEYGSHDLGNEERAITLGREWIIGLNMVFRKQLFLSVGGFNDKLGMNGAQTAFGEEINLFLLMHERGEEIYYVPSVRVSHLVRAEKMQLRYLFATWYMSGRNHCLTFRVRRSLSEIILSLAATGVKAAVRMIPRKSAPFKRTLYYAISPLIAEMGSLVEYVTTPSARR